MAMPTMRIEQNRMGYIMNPPLSMTERMVQPGTVFSWAAQAHSAHATIKGRLNSIDFNGIMDFLMQGSGASEGFHPGVFGLKDL